VSAIVFWPWNNETLTATSFLLICLAIIDNVMLFLYYLLIGLYETCSFYNTCQYYRQVRRTIILSPRWFLYHIFFDQEQQSKVPVYKLVNSQNELCELFSVSAHVEVNILCYYRQHCAKRKTPVFNLLRGRF